MANQVLTPPEIEPREPAFLNEVVDEPVWKTIANNLRDLFHPEKLPPLELTSTPIPVPDRMAVKRGPMSSIVSVLFHAALIAIIIAAYLLLRNQIKVQPKNEVVTNINVPPYMPIAPKGPAMGGGGGGGSHDIIQTPKGKLPQIKPQPIVPPMVIKNDHPKLAVEPAIMLPKNIQLPTNNMPNLGDPRTSVVGPASNGPGNAAGMGSGSGGGIGQGSGNGYGPGSGGGYGGGVYHVGGGVSPPQVIYSVEPEFSEEARRAKYQGVVVLSIVVDAQGNPQRVQVVRHLGMGLDQKAIEAVKQYRFKPAMLNGKPVPVQLDIEINFHIY